MKKHDFRQSVRALKKDPKFAKVIREHGPLDLESYLKRGRAVFPALLRSIIYQQISGKAAASILARVRMLYPRGKPTPALVMKTPDRKLRAAGLSPQKLAYVKDLARKYLDGTIDERRFGTMTSEEIIEHVTRVKGVGVWTAHMLLIFTMHRPDILPTGDLGIQKGFQILYNTRGLPDHKKMERLARPWRAHATAGSWYLWRVADAAKEKRTSAKAS